MSAYTGQTPDTPRPVDWRAKAVCREQGDLWFPLPGNTIAVHVAKQACFTCPVMLACGQHALTRGITDGVWGGLSEGQRAALQRKHPAAVLDDPAAAGAVILAALRNELNPVQSLRDLWNDRTRVLPGGHIGWTGDSGSFSHRGHTYTPKQLAFLLDRGHKATGIVRRVPECQVVECVSPRHLADNAERYQRKLALEETVRRAALAAAVEAEMAS